jgi:hypothetical protein
MTRTPTVLDDAMIARLLQEVREDQQTVLRELRDLRAVFERQQRRPSRADLLSAIAAVVETRAFTAKEVIDHAEFDASLAAALDLADLCDGRRLGRYLRYLEAHPRGALCVIRLDEDHDGIIWRIWSAKH